MWSIIGIIIGLLIRYLIYEPYQRKRIRDECIRDGLVPGKVGD